MQTYVAQFARRRGFPDLDPKSDVWRMKAVMPSSKLRDNVRAWETVVRAKCGMDSTKVTTGFMNTTQTAAWSPVAQWVPALITCSQLWSMRRQRYLLLQELAQVQGFAVTTKSDFPCPRNFARVILDADAGNNGHGSIAESHVRRMLGNGMSLHVVGALLLYAMCFATRLPQPPPGCLADDAGKGYDLPSHAMPASSSSSCEAEDQMNEDSPDDLAAEPPATRRKVS